MKISELLLESAQYIVYKVSSPHTDRVYYGYATGASMEDAKKGFLTGGTRTDADQRGDGKMLQAAKEDVHTLKFELVDVSPDEVEAFTSRNDNRAQDSTSITGPTQFPGNVYKRAMEKHPERAKLWKVQQSLATMHVRDAMNEPSSGLTYDNIKALVAANPKIKPELLKDMDSLQYPAFMAKYFPKQ
jgi:hypothetical protein